MITDLWGSHMYLMSLHKYAVYIYMATFTHKSLLRSIFSLISLPVVTFQDLPPCTFCDVHCSQLKSVVGVSITTVDIIRVVCLAQLVEVCIRVCTVRNSVMKYTTFLWFLPTHGEYELVCHPYVSPSQHCCYRSRHWALALIWLACQDTLSNASVLVAVIP